MSRTLSHEHISCMLIVVVKLVMAWNLAFSLVLATCSVRVWRMLLHTLAQHEKLLLWSPLVTVLNELALVLLLRGRGRAGLGTAGALGVVLGGLWLGQAECLEGLLRLLCLEWALNGTLLGLLALEAKWFRNII